MEPGKSNVHSVRRPRQGWDAQFRLMADRGDDELLDGYVPTQWESDAWEWAFLQKSQDKPPDARIAKEKPDA